MKAEQATDPVAFHGEGPVWSPRWGGLRWVDLLAGDVLSLADDGQVHRRHVSRILAVLRPRRGGGAVLGLERGFALEDPLGVLTPHGPLWEGEDRRMNEGGCDPDGRFYCGSMAYDQREGAGSLYRLDPDLSVHRVLDRVTISNGLEWSPDGSRAYYNDTATQRISVFDYQRQQGLTSRRVLVDLSAEEASPDGLTVDAQGGVWVALAAAGEVRCYSPEGKLQEVIEVPARKVTACAFGGPGLRTLFITTSQEGRAPGTDPLAGSLFRAVPGVAGLPVREFFG